MSHGTTRRSMGQDESYDTDHRRDRYFALAPLGHHPPPPARRDRAARDRLRGREERRHRATDRERTRTPARSGGRAAARRAQRAREPPHRGRQPARLSRARGTRRLTAGEEELGALAGLEAGTIHIGASTTPGVYLLPDTLGCFRRDHPNVDVEVEIASTDEMIERLLAGRVQLALVGETQVDERVELTPFLTDEIVGIAKPGLLPIKAGRIKPAALAEQTLLVREAGSSTRQIGGARARRARARARHESGSSTRARRSSAPPAKDSASPSSRAMPSPRRSSAASSRASASEGSRESSGDSTSPGSPGGR